MILDNATIWIDIDQLQYWDRNPNEGDIGKIMMSIKEFGWNDTCQYWNGVIKGGNHSVMALQQLRKLGWHPDKCKIPSKCLSVNDDGWQIAMIDTSEMSEIISNAFGIALNGTQRAGRDDPAMLAELLQEFNVSTELLLESTSFNADDVDELLSSLSFGLIGNDLVSDNVREANSLHMTKRDIGDGKMVNLSFGDIMILLPYELYADVAHCVLGKEEDVSILMGNVLVKGMVDA